MSCPSCAGGRLKRRLKVGYKLRVCTSCKGMWVKRREARRLMAEIAMKAWEGYVSVN